MNIFKAIRTRIKVIDEIVYHEKLYTQMNYNQTIEENIGVRIDIIESMEECQSKINLLKSLL